VTTITTIIKKKTKTNPMNIDLHQPMITTCSTIDGNDDHRRREAGDRRAECGTDSVKYGNREHAKTNIDIGQKGRNTKNIMMEL
jgi:hypothetical protein